MSVQLQTSSYAAQLLALTAGRNKTQATGAETKFSVDILAEISVATEVKEVAEPTIEDVKKEFYDFLDNLDISPGLSKTSITVNISDAAFEKMLVDPEYKQQMMDLCERDLCDPTWTRMAAIAPDYIVVQIPGNSNNQWNSEYLASSGGSATRGEVPSLTDQTFWTKRSKKKEEAKEVSKKRQEEKDALERFLERLRERKAAMNESLLASFSQKASAYSGASPGSALVGDSQLSSLLVEA